MKQLYSELTIYPDEEEKQASIL